MVSNIALIWSGVSTGWIIGWELRSESMPRTGSRTSGQNWEPWCEQASVIANTVKVL